MDSRPDEAERRIFVIDETLERRQGPKITYKGWFRDPIRSTAKQVSYALGIRWIRLCRNDHRIRTVEPTTMGPPPPEA